MKAFRGDKTKRTPQPKNEGWVAPSFDVLTRVLVFVFFKHPFWDRGGVSTQWGDTFSVLLWGLFFDPETGLKVLVLVVVVVVLVVVVVRVWCVGGLVGGGRAGAGVLGGGCGGGAAGGAGGNGGGGAGCGVVVVVGGGGGWWWVLVVVLVVVVVVAVGWMSGWVGGGGKGEGVGWVGVVGRVGRWGSRANRCVDASEEKGGPAKRDPGLSFGMTRACLATGGSRSAYLGF